MSQDVELRCRCGEVHGWVRGVSASTINRAVCYCADCQAFLHHLGRADLLDEHGGTDIVQVAPRALAFDRGTDCIAAVRLSPKGMHRWYATCCKTPLGNTLTPALPFVGIAPEVFHGAPDASHRDEVFGPVRGRIFGQHATGGAPQDSTKTNWKMLLHTLRLLLGWKLGGAAWPHPFFDRATRAPSYPVVILSREEREALRAHCGPRPAASAARAA